MHCHCARGIKLLLVDFGIGLQSLAWRVFLARDDRRNTGV